MEYCSLGTLWSAMRTGAFHHPPLAATWTKHLGASASASGQKAMEAAVAAAAATAAAYRAAVAPVGGDSASPAAGQAAGAVVLQGKLEWEAWSVIETIKEIVAALQV